MTDQDKRTIAIQITGSHPAIGQKELGLLLHQYLRTILSTGPRRLAVSLVEVNAEYTPHTEIADALCLRADAVEVTVNTVASDVTITPPTKLQLFQHHLRGSGIRFSTTRSGCEQCYLSETVYVQGGKGHVIAIDHLRPEDQLVVTLMVQGVTQKGMKHKKDVFSSIVDAERRVIELYRASLEEPSS